MDFPDYIVKETLESLPALDIIEIVREYRKKAENDFEDAIADAISNAYTLGYMSARSRYYKEDEHEKS